MVEDDLWHFPIGLWLHAVAGVRVNQLTEPSRHQPRLTPARARAALQLTRPRGDRVDRAAGPPMSRQRRPGMRRCCAFVVACAILVTLDLFAAAGVYRPRHLGSPGSPDLARGRGLDVGSGAARHVRVRRPAAAGRCRGNCSWSGGRSAWRCWWRCTRPPRCWSARGQRAGWLATRLVLVGAGPQAASFIHRVRQHDPGIVIAGLFDDRRSRVPAMVEGCPVLGTLDDLAEFARTRARRSDRHHPAAARGQPPARLLREAAPPARRRPLEPRSARPRARRPRHDRRSPACRCCGCSTAR